MNKDVEEQYLSGKKQTKLEIGNKKLELEKSEYKDNQNIFFLSTLVVGC